MNNQQKERVTTTMISAKKNEGDAHAVTSASMWPKTQHLTLTQFITHPHVTSHKDHYTRIMQQVH